ncbi:MAG: thioredoxin family protein [Candidatus Babeliales bacterium]
MKKFILAVIVVLGAQSNMQAAYSEVSSAADLNSALRGDKSIVMFGSNSCPHCRQMKPLFTQAAQGSTATFIFVDTNRLSSVADQYGIRGIPTFKLFKNGSAVGSRTGSMSKAELTSFVNQ